LSSSVIFGALRRHGLTLLLAMLGAMSTSLLWSDVPPAAATYWCDELCREEEEDERRREEESWREDLEDPTPEYTLKVNVKGPGTVTYKTPTEEVGSCPAILSTAPCLLRIEEGYSFTLSPAPYEGATFIGWEGACTGTDTCKGTMPEDLEVTASFVDPTPPLVPTIVTPAKGELVQQEAGSGVVVTFNDSGDPGAPRFLCRLNTSDYRLCTSPWTTRHLKAGPNTVRVRARDAAGNTSTPVTRRFTVVD